MKNTVKLSPFKSATVEDQGLMVGIQLKSGFFTIDELMDPDTAQALGDALLMAANKVQANREGAGVSA